ncbi:MAG: glycosyltransferase family 2 protein [Promethearchaeota archaeon]|jgi:hypothetical protein
MKIALLILTFDEVGIPDYLRRVIDGIKRQIIDADVDVLFVDNLSSDNFRDEMKKECDENNWECISIPQPRYPIQVCKNIGWKWFTRNTKYDYYAVGCDDIVMNSPGDLQTIIRSFTPDHGAVTPYVNYDAAPVKEWRKVAEKHFKRKQDVELSHSFWAYAHFAAYSNEFFERFNYREIDILWNYGMESLLVYLCKSVGMKWKWCFQTVLYNTRKGSTKGSVHRKHRLPNNIFGVRPDRRTHTGVSVTLHGSPDPEKKSSYVIFDNKVADFDLASNAARFDAIFSEGTKIGLGWHRVEGVQYVPDMSNYDSNGEHKDKEKLYEYIMKHLFLSSEALNYEDLLNSSCFVRMKG